MRKKKIIHNTSLHNFALWRRSNSWALYSPIEGQKWTKKLKQGENGEICMLNSESSEWFGRCPSTGHDWSLLSYEKEAGHLKVNYSKNEASMLLYLLTLFCISYWMLVLMPSFLFPLFIPYLSFSLHSESSVADFLLLMNNIALVWESNQLW